ncbi:PP0621 family protein [Variovorax sp.]|uniref:PP0621 family protein n=1 Tax=Variovorax sp. TaxID=1871043 RepID=UPI00137FBE62|nr:PP0621 family protein [Variovorax sp.]KAF1069698.1 MAG: hypothetical protein GAK39_02510 [Variovorax sp.]
MKYLLVLAVVWVAIWLWRKNRREEMQERAARTPRPASPPAVGAPQAMVRCAHCGLHLPASDAVRGTDGTPYCSAAHRQVAERA